MSLRDTLAQKRRRTAVYRIPGDGYEAAEERLQSALLTYGFAQLQAAAGKAEAALVLSAEEQVAKARAEMDAASTPIPLANMPAAEFEALVTAWGELTDEQRTAATWTADMLEVQVLAACASGGEMTAEEWAAELARPEWARDDAWDLLNAAMGVNIRRRSLSLGNG